MIAEQLHKTIINYLRDYEPERIGLFGSYVRGEDSDDSDIDILIRFRDSCSLFQLIRIENELTELIGRKVDLVTGGSITNERIRKSIFGDLRIIYEA